MARMIQINIAAKTPQYLMLKLSIVPQGFKIFFWAVTWF
jgi:hypothetical protein